jgi:undecaprenyl-diphosphatase
MKPSRILPLGRGALALARAELAATAALLVAALGIFSFIGILDEIGEGNEFDQAVLAAMRVGGDPSQTVGPPWLHQAAVELTSFGDSWVLGVILVIAAGFLLIQRRFGHAALLVGAVVGGTLLSEGLKEVFGRERPPADYRLVEVASQSFPSGHAMLSAVTYLTLGALVARILPRKRLRAYVLATAFALAGMVGLTRIYLGVHWTTDVIGGWSLGAAWAMAFWLFAYAIERLRASRRLRAKALRDTPTTDANRGQIGSRPRASTGSGLRPTGTSAGTPS